MICNRCVQWSTQHTKHTCDWNMCCVCGPDLREHRHEFKCTLDVIFLDLPCLLVCRHLDPLPHDVPQEQICSEHANLPRADTCGCVYELTMYSTHHIYNNTQCMRAGHSHSHMLYMTYKRMHGYALDTLFGCQVGIVASPIRVRPAVEHQAEGIEKLLRTCIHT